MRRLSSSDSTERVNESEVENSDKEKKSHGTSRKKGKLRLIKDYLIDYTENSNLHGLKYIGEKKRTFVEKIFWLFMFICSVVLCAGLIRKVWIKWNESPVIVSFAENSTPVWQIPYPAVTVCFETKAMQTRFNFTKYYHLYLNETTHANLTEEEKHLFEDVSMICDDHLAPTSGRKFSVGNITVENIKELSPNITEVFKACKWKDVGTDACEELFSPILTEEGLCYTFNTMGAAELFRVENLHKEYEYLEHRNSTQTWSLEAGYPPSAPLETYPHRGSGYGAKAGLVMLLRVKEEDLDYLCKGPVQGFKILLHNPAELPRLSQQYFRLPLAQEVVVAVKPKMMTTSEGLKPYDPDRRQCYFPSERYLLFFKVYTQTNCEMECLSNFTKARCGCVHFGLPHGPDTKVCNAGNMNCTKTAQMELVTVEIQSGMEAQIDNETFGEARAVAARCKCLPACTSIEYEAETSQADFDWKALYSAFNLPIENNDADYEGKSIRATLALYTRKSHLKWFYKFKHDTTDEKLTLHYSRVMIYFKEAQFITSRRSELYGQTDFLANCGGLLGLFMGFSILSVAEIIYFLTLRLWCLLRRHRRRSSLKTNVLNSNPKLALD